MAFKKFIQNINFFILAESICAICGEEGIWDKATFCKDAPNCKCTYMTEKLGFKRWT